MKIPSHFCLSLSMIYLKPVYFLKRERRVRKRGPSYTSVKPICAAAYLSSFTLRFSNIQCVQKKVSPPNILH